MKRLIALLILILISTIGNATFTNTYLRKQDATIQDIGDKCGFIGDNTFRIAFPDPLLSIQRSDQTKQSLILFDENIEFLGVKTRKAIGLPPELLGLAIYSGGLVDPGRIMTYINNADGDLQFGFGFFEPILTIEEVIDNAPAVDIGGGFVGIPITGHEFAIGQLIVIGNTDNYDGVYFVESQTTNQIVILATYVSETFDGDECVDSIGYDNPGQTFWEDELNDYVGGKYSDIDTDIFHLRNKNGNPAGIAIESLNPFIDFLNRNNIIDKRLFRFILDDDDKLYLRAVEDDLITETNIMHWDTDGITSIYNELNIINPLGSKLMTYRNTVDVFDDELISRFSFEGLTGEHQTEAAKIDIIADGNWLFAENRQPTRIEFCTQDIAATNRLINPAIRINSEQSTFIGDVIAGNYIEIDKAGDLDYYGTAGVLFAEIRIEDNTTSQELATKNQWYKITQFNTNGESNGSVITDQANNKITVSAGKYNVMVSFSFENTVNENFEFQLRHNSVAFGPCIESRLGVNDHRTVSFSSTGSFNESDDVELWGRCLSGDNESILLAGGNLFVRKLAGN